MTAYVSTGHQIIVTSQTQTLKLHNFEK